LEPFWSAIKTENYFHNSVVLSQRWIQSPLTTRKKAVIK
jgi:hypothetical protein